MPEIHIAITRKVKRGLESEFETSLKQFVRNSISIDGMSGVHVLRPALESSSNEYGVLRSFRSESDANKFYASDLFSEWLNTIEPLVEGQPLRRRLSGLEAFFRSGGSTMPPKWKMAIITFVGVLPSVLFWSNALPPFLAGLHWFVVSVVVNAAVVASLTWFVMPQLTRMFHPWLHPNENQIEAKT